MTTLNILLAGPGLIGSALLQQFAASKTKNVTIRLVGIANSKKFVITAEGLDHLTAKDKLAASGKEGSVIDFVNEGAKLGLSKTIFVDCTASDAVSPAYAHALKCNISVVTANKKVNSGDLVYRNEVMELAHKPEGPRFRYEANVGAGLPIIKPLNDFVASGDEVIHIEAILSGTLAFLFNTFNKDVKFSQVVKKAKELGYTEPDPRDDLNGSDVARKIVILARDSGYNVSLDDVEIVSILPESCVNAASVEEFFVALEKDCDPAIEARRAKAEASGEVLRFIASFAVEGGSPKLRIELLSVPLSHPAAGLSGSDNICILRTKRYDANPCVIKGPGAGDAVTAAGVFGDIISLQDVNVMPKAA